MKNVKKPFKITLTVIAVILALLICWSGVMFWYYPHYKKQKTELLINDIYYENQIRVMSYNLRCINPMDAGKKTWFYRADLIIKSIQKEQPGIMPKDN